MIPWILLVSVGLLAFIVFKLATDSKNWLEYSKYFPLIAFLWTAKLLGMTEEAWRCAFILGGIAAVIFTALFVHKNVILDRLMLGANLFLVIGAIGFLFRAGSILYWYGMYEGASFLFPIVLVGLATMTYSTAGFIGVLHANNNTIRSASIKLLVVTLFAFGWSIVANNAGLFISAALPFIILKVIQSKLIEWNFHKHTI